MKAITRVDQGAPDQRDELGAYPGKVDALGVEHPLGHDAAQGGGQDQRLRTRVDIRPDVAGLDGHADQAAEIGGRFPVEGGHGLGQRRLVGGAHQHGDIGAHLHHADRGTLEGGVDGRHERRKSRRSALELAAHEVELVVDGLRHGGQEFVLRAEIVPGETPAVACPLARLGERQAVNALLGNDLGGGGENPGLGFGTALRLRPLAADRDRLLGRRRLALGCAGRGHPCHPHVIIFAC
jgi:hypothetical protein